MQQTPSQNSYQQSNFKVFKRFIDFGAQARSQVYDPNNISSNKGYNHN
jgi:hypothetical protein